MIVNRKNKYKGYFTVDELTLKDKSGKDYKREIVVRESAVAALVYDTMKEKYIFVSQYRVGSSSQLIEIVAGLLDHPSEDPREAITREIEEEIGYKVDTCILVDECYTSPGGTSEVVSIYFCEVSQKISEGGGLATENEDIEVVEMDRKEMLSTRFKDAKTIIAVNWARYEHITTDIKNTNI